MAMNYLIEEFPQPVDLFSVKPVSKVGAINNAPATAVRRDGSRGHSNGQHTPQKQNRDFFGPLARAAIEANKRLEKQKSPLRLRVFQNANGVFVALWRQSGGYTQEVLLMREITEEDFVTWVNDIEELDGIMLDVSS